MKQEHSLFFDRQDHELLSIIDHALDRGGDGGKSERDIFDALLHPHGIIDLASSRTERMAIAVINLLGSLEAGQVEDRLVALRSLHDEVLHSAQTSFRYNTGRVLIQMMKEIVRTRDDTMRRLMLVHDFRQAATGNPRIVRRFLAQYHLIEMPENNSQLAMDHHVHDSNTKGRKNPTHLVMDAWVKGLRFLTIIYYNYATPEALRELFKAAEIMDISVRIGIEYRAPCRDGHLSIVWEPSDLRDANEAITFLDNPAVAEAMRKGREASDWTTRRVLDVLDNWNTELLPIINRDLALTVPPIDRERFLGFVGSGQASFLHLAEMIHRWMHPSLKIRFQETERALRELEEARGLAPADAAPPDIELLRERLVYLNNLTPEVILHTWLSDQRRLMQPCEHTHHTGDEVLPEFLRLAPDVLTERLLALRPSAHIWLNLANLTPEDVLELLWDCKGRITHLETFNLKEWQEGRTPHLTAISRIQQAINEGGPLLLKQIVRDLLRRNMREGNDPARCEKLRIILRDLPTLQRPYLYRPLRSRIGTDSTSHAGVRHGMGLVLPETLPGRVQRQLRRSRDEARLRLPIHLNIYPRLNFFPPRRHPFFNARFAHWVRNLTGWSRFGSHKKWEWMVNSNTARIQEPGNVITIGGIGLPDNGFIPQDGKSTRSVRPGLAYLNTAALNTLKVAAGFSAAMLTFLYTQQWWVLAWFGAVIWFAITALRNVIQAVLSGGGVIQTSLLRWNDYVSGTRVCDSLMYTGYSVPLLELGIRYLLLERALGITVANQPTLVFAIIALTNGFYIASHNIYRGFPKEAIIGNMFRSVLAIPCSLLYHDLLLTLLNGLGVLDPVGYLQLGAAIISKAASDTVAGLIEGIADRRNNLRLRYWDYKTKLSQLFDTYTRMELAYPETNMLRLLARPRDLQHFTEERGKRLRVAAIVNSLDLMYFWHYQPQAQQALYQVMRIMTRDERTIFSRSQLVLSRVREVSQLFVNGMVGDHFSKALAFYLDRHEDYIALMQQLCVEDPHADDPNDTDDSDDIFAPPSRDEAERDQALP